jgi:hypothetical protein
VSVKTIEQALQIMGERIQSDYFATFARERLMEASHVKYALIIKKTNKGEFVVSLDCQPMEPKQSFGAFFKLK